MDEAEVPQTATVAEKAQGLPAPPAEAAPVETAAQAAPTPAPAQAAAQTPSAPPAQPAPTPAPAGPSTLQKVGNVLEKVASVMVAITPAIPPGPMVLAADAVDAGLRMLAGWLSSQGSLNADSEAAAEAALKRLTDTLADLSAPLPAPAELEAQSGAATE